MSPPLPKKGQEWEKAGGYRRLATRIRIVTDPDTSVHPRVYVESLLKAESPKGLYPAE